MADGREIFGQWTTPVFWTWNNGNMKITYNKYDNPMLTPSGLNDETIFLFHENKLFKNYKYDKCLSVLNKSPTLNTNKGIRFYRASSRRNIKDNELFNVFNEGPKD